MSQASETYTLDVEELISSVKDRQNKEKSILSSRLRELFDQSVGTDPKASLVVYGEQAAPPIA